LFSELKSILEEKCAQIEGVKKMSELVLKYDFSDGGFLCIVAELGRSHTGFEI
jgi:hypothetical protein